MKQKWHSVVAVVVAVKSYSCVYSPLLQWLGVYC